MPAVFVCCTNKFLDYFHAGIVVRSGDKLICITREVLAGVSVYQECLR
ncbi:MAG: Unknown protein [uncultured Thiotrichaceae bacterium]|uniref:Uncharacterized protein n=1 Tax=uncultured Thiotrichaceae bacterium TaxID=298394 RepID=A0A6S6T3L5_9GAMM|nr:MAG: Unknown protein [uncultured Thiotrichaceae bacterium]